MTPRERHVYFVYRSNRDIAYLQNSALGLYGGAGFAEIENLGSRLVPETRSAHAFRYEPSVGTLYVFLSSELMIQVPLPKFANYFERYK